MSYPNHDPQDPNGNLRRHKEPHTTQDPYLDNGWIKSSSHKPECNVSVLVFIPEEDDHVTTGMWDISKKWVLLDEYRVPMSEVTFWRPIDYELPNDKSFKKSDRDYENDSMSNTIRDLQKRIFDLEKLNKEGR